MSAYHKLIQAAKAVKARRLHVRALMVAEDRLVLSLLDEALDEALAPEAIVIESLCPIVRCKVPGGHVHLISNDSTCGCERGGYCMGPPCPRWEHMQHHAALTSIELCDCGKSQGAEVHGEGALNGHAFKKREPH